MELSEVWAALEAETPAESEIKARGVGVDTDQGELRVGLDGAGRPHLLIPVLSETKVREDRRSRGVQIIALTLREGGKQQPFADVVCWLPQLSEIFRSLVGEMVEAISRRPQAALAATVSVLNKWRELLERGSARLGADALAGLFAELWHLQLVLERNNSASLEVWRGPRAEVFDFRYPGVALEVKATVRREGRLVQVHGVEQLSPPDESVLYLAYTRLSVEETGTSVPQLVEQLVQLGADSIELTRLLGEVGYTAAETWDYEATRFAIAEHRVYQVMESFPRIVPGSFSQGYLPPGIVDINYTIDLTNEPPNPLTENESSVLFETLAGNR